MGKNVQYATGSSLAAHLENEEAPGHQVRASGTWRSERLGFETRPRIRGPVSACRGGARGDRRGIARGAGVRTIDLDELRRAVAAVAPSAVLVPGRQLRRVIRRDRGLRFLGRRGALLTTYIIAGPSLAATMRPSDLGLVTEGNEWPPEVLLLEHPGAAAIASSPPEPVLNDTWRRLFRVRVQSDLEARARVGELASVAIGERLRRIGLTEFEEARTVLSEDGLLLPPTTDASAYAAFAAHFLELTVFAPALRSATFPATEELAGVARLLNEDVDSLAVLAETRLAGPRAFADASPASSAAHHPGDVPGRNGEAHARSASRRPGTPERRNRPATLARVARVERSADRASQRGNDVRAAILRGRADGLRSGSASGSGTIPRECSRAALRDLARRLVSALGVDAADRERWADALAPLLRRASGRFWAQEARLLYDLQKVCLEHERETYRVDWFGWFRSLGRGALRQPMPDHRAVAISAHLRSAETRLSRVPLTRDDRARIHNLLAPAVRHAEDALRERIRPRIEAALAATWPRPGSLPERVALSKLVEELLDRVEERGFSNLGDLRDAASRSDLKQPDLAGPGEFWRGGRLLSADHALAEGLPGVHHRGEIYLRWLQRLSMLTSGTSVGRWLTCFVLLPFGGSFVALKGLDHLAGLTLGRILGIHVELFTPISLLLVGAVTAGAINSARFRAELFRALSACGRALRVLLVDWPTRVANSPIVLRLLASRGVRRAWRFAVKPGIVTAAAWWFLGLFRTPTAARVPGTAGVFAVSNIVFNTRAGRVVGELAADAASRVGRSVVEDVLPGLFRLIMAAFRRVVEAIERVLYEVDELLRFRGGQSRWTLACKTIIAPFWGALAYLTRLYVNVLVEPQLNPIKHFPVVTVSHKLTLPYAIHLTAIFAAPLVPVVGPFAGNFIAAANVLLLPGLFGFLVWELKENWRLYEANRPDSLRPVVVGSHGETVLRLLRPGFHSGTLPKTFARYRKSSRSTWPGPGRNRPEKAALKQREALHHVEIGIRRFIDRDLIALLAGTRELGRSRLSLGDIHLATNRVRFGVRREDSDASQSTADLMIDLEYRAGVLIGGVSRAGWLGEPDPGLRVSLDDALTGFFRRSGVDLVRAPGLPVGTDLPAGSAEVGSGTDPDGLALRSLSLPWRLWVETWNREASGQSSPVPLAGREGVLASAFSERSLEPGRGDPVNLSS